MTENEIEKLIEDAVEQFAERNHIIEEIAYYEFAKYFHKYFIINQK